MARSYVTRTDARAGWRLPGELCPGRLGRGLSLAAASLGDDGRFPAITHKLIQRHACDIATEIRLASIYRFNGVHQLVKQRLLQNETARAALDHPQDEIGAALRRKDQHFDFRKLVL